MFFDQLYFPRRWTRRQMDNSGHDAIRVSLSVLEVEYEPVSVTDYPKLWQTASGHVTGGFEHHDSWTTVV